MDSRHQKRRRQFKVIQSAVLSFLCHFDPFPKYPVRSNTFLRFSVNLNIKIII